MGRVTPVTELSLSISILISNSTSFEGEPGSVFALETVEIESCLETQGTRDGTATTSTTDAPHPVGDR
ncbi:hypothetical protein [Halomontanus rarus]|uniref:hypothetical protein n=1 Tax=Halomontanus rarus TaxID=3034020 RepID=UPI0023E843EF|nr:hypothetical protein [Halovivax sp. TS33]